ncbi:acyl-coenzyme A thioesterase 13-like isoform X2 [Strongylocentrotus purpuratus]|uniref:Thioesterase domain-containing protein n=1 Tax=Strongylocentrotus purpuratus TaxID=7668 RepID=A0A7M7NQX5_STRPU|nr:acyl-coenzyme A thioesterase 13-like isoform X2 [Strongylocentrotus purpuratus]
MDQGKNPFSVAFDGTRNVHTVSVWKANLKLVAATPNKVTAEYVVKIEHCNHFGTLHGGFTATAVDFMTSLALIVDEEDSRPGVSLNLSVNYMKALKVGDKVTLEGEVMRKGRSVAYTTARIFNEKGDLAAHGTHIKHLGHS